MERIPAYDGISLIDWSFAAFDRFELAALQPRIFCPTNRYGHARAREDLDAFTASIMRHHNGNNHEIISSLVKLYTGKQAEFRRACLEALQSKSALVELMMSLKEVPHINYETEIAEFLQRETGRMSNISIEVLLQHL